MPEEPTPRTQVLSTSTTTVSTTPALLRPDIPTEIHLCIADHLPIHSTACLALTCKTLLRIHGTRSWAALKNPRNPLLDKLSDFLLLLERDLPTHYLSSYHLPKLSKQLPWSKTQPPNPQGTYSVLSHFHVSIPWNHVVLALKRAKHGPPHGLPLAIFAHQTTHITPRTSTTPPLPANVTTHFATESRIVSGRLLLRATYLVSAEGQHLSRATLKSLHMSLCRHTGTASRSSPWYDNTLAKQLGARSFTADNLDPEGDVHDLLAEAEQAPREKGLSGNCSLCMTDWSVEPVTLPLHASPSPPDPSSANMNPPPCDSKLASPSPPPPPPTKRAWLITTWQNLGSCASPHHERDPQNEIWTAFAGGPGSYGHLVRVLKYPWGCVRAAFDGGGEEGARLVEIEGTV
tara:strand:+ start:5609 stop:6817 length:1209 start_codon:yes stop_codon:yes gene_type:complete